MKKSDLENPNINSQDEDYTSDAEYSEFSVDEENDEEYCLDETENDDKDYQFNYEVYLIVDFVSQTKQLDGIFTNSYYLRPEMKDILKKHVLDKKYVFSTSDVNYKKGLINKMNVSELSALLKKNGIPASGKRKKLIKLLEKNIDSLDMGTGEYNLTETGEKFLKDCEWIKIYESTLDSFSFNDYNRFVEKSTGDNYIEITRKYLNEHFKNAQKKENFKYLHECIIADTFLSAYEHDSKKELKGELREFIWRINPVYDFKEFYEKYELIDIENINRIKILCEQLEIQNFKRFFYNVWDRQNLTESVTADEGFKFLNTLLESKNIEKESLKFYNDNILDTSKQITLDFFS